MMKAKTDQEACDLLDNLVIASPCSIPWSAMAGDERKRLCGGCARFVHNISDMTKAEAESFLRENGTSQCMIFYRRFDGTILTDDCPAGLRRIRNACKLVYRVAASFFVMLVSVPGAIAQQLQSNQAQSVKQTRQATPSPGFRHMDQFGEKSARDMDEPAPPGFVYTANPAGGGRIMRPATNIPVQQPLNPDQPAVPVQATPIAIPRQTPVATPRPISTPTFVPRHRRPETPVLSSPEFVPSPQGHANLDTNANSLYEKGRQAANAGKKSLAEFYYEKAIDAFDNQKAGDKKFRIELERALKSVQDK